MKFGFIKELVSFSHKEVEAERLTPVMRTYNFDQNQFVGVVLGYRMSEENKRKIVDIFKTKKQCFRRLPVTRSGFYRMRFNRVRF